MLAVLLGLLLGQAAAQPPAAITDVRALKLSEPRVVAEIDTATVQGDPIGLAVRADGTLYLRVTDARKHARHYLIATQPAVSMGQSDGLPGWAAEYWKWKAGFTAPGNSGLKLAAEQRRERGRTVNTNSGDEIAGNMSAVIPGGGEAMGQGIAIAAANNSIMAGTVTVRFKGQVVGEWTDQVPSPGARFGWAPAPMSMLAYTDTDGRLFLLDAEGRKVAVPGVSQALLPAWSPDGTRLWSLQKKSRGIYLLTETLFQ